MSTKQGRVQLKTYFETGDRPTEQEFSWFINSGINQVDDPLYVETDDSVVVGRDPDARGLKVNTTINIQGNIYGDKAGQGASKDVLQIFNGSGVQLFGESYPGRGGSMFLIGDKSLGKGEIHFSQRLGTGSWRNNGLIDENGNFGIGTQTPADKLQVENGINRTVVGNAYGSSFDWSTGYLGFNVSRGQNNQWELKSDGANNGGGMIHSKVNGGLHFSTVPRSASNANIDQTFSDSNMKNHIRMSILGNGNVGINERSPDNLLHVRKTSGSDTGLRLENGAGINKVLMSNSAGDARWVPKTDVTDGLWIESGSNIYNGNSGGHVGINASNPKEDLQIGDRLTIRGGYTSSLLSNNAYYNEAQNKFKRLVNAIPASMQMSNNGIDFLISGSGGAESDIIWDNVMRLAPDGEVGIGITAPIAKLHVNGNTRIDNGNLDIQLRHNIYLRDGNHGIGWFGEISNDNNNTNDKYFEGTENIDGPVVFGHDGGAIGSRRGSVKRTAMRWKHDRTVDFRGNVTVAGNSPIIMKRFQFGVPLQDPGELSGGYPTGYYYNDFGVAFIAGWEFSEGRLLHNNHVRMYVYTYLGRAYPGAQLQWYVKAELSSKLDDEKWDVDVVFIRRQISELVGGASEFDEDL